jgi:hypothetical protein
MAVREESTNQIDSSAQRGLEGVERKGEHHKERRRADEKDHTTTDGGSNSQHCGNQ